MSVGHGKDTRVHLNGRNMSSYLKSADLTMSAESHETTTMGAAAVTRIGGLFDSKVSLDGFHNGAANATIDTVEAALAAATGALLIVWLLGDAIVGAIGYAMRCRSSDYDVSMPSNNTVTTAFGAEGDGDIERVECLHPMGAETTTGTGTALDNAASSANGGAIWLEASAFTGTSVTLSVEHSPDNSSWSTLGTFTAVTGVTAERIPVSGTINRYTRSKVGTGTFSSVTFCSGISRN